MNYLKIILSLLALSLSQHAHGATILYYDSNSGGSTEALDRIDTETDAAFVASSDAFTSLGASATYVTTHASQVHTVTLGDQPDMMFRFGTGAYSDDLPTALADGKWLGMSFVAAQDLNLEELTFILYNNSNNASSYAARDVGLYVRIGNVGAFTQFGDIDDSATGNGNQGTITFSDLFTVLSGQTVQLRLAFTDRTRSNEDAQAATRVGSINISASAGGDATKVTTSSTAPTADILVSDPTGGTDTSLFDEVANANHARGQLFPLADGSGTGYEITAITIKKSIDQTYANDAITLRLFEGTSAQWTTGTGHSTGIDGGDYYVDTSVTPLYTEVFTLNGAFTNNDYVTFTLSHPVIVDEDSDFGFFMTYHQRAGTEDRFRHRENSNGGRISITDVGHGVITTRGLHYFVHGTTTGVVENLVLASPFQDRMVLQRGKPVKVWGEALPSTAVSVTFDGNTVNGTSDANGDWQVELPTHAAGGPYTLEVTSGVETKTVSDVLVGDVWLCFGQSNMVYNMNSMQSWKTSYINDISANDNIRCLKIKQDAALTEEETAEMSWLDNSTVSTWTAVGSVFAHQLNAETGVPVAIIWAAWGSSAIEGWMPLELADQFPHFAEMLELYQGIGEYESGTTINSTISGTYPSNLAAITDLTTNGWSGTPLDVFIRTRPNIIYNKMVHPIRKFGISGFIWYQGEANSGAPNYARYRFTLPRFVEEYRERFGQGDLPFLGVQLPSYGNGTYWPWFRESQDQIHNLNNGHVVVSIDNGDAGGNIHPTNTSKEEIGTRLSLLARKYALGESIVADSPRYQSMSISGDEVTITFDHAVGLTTDDALDPAEFELAGANEVFYPATSSAISGSDVIVSASANVPNPVAVRYAWSSAPLNEVNLVNGAGLPAAPFRTDSFAPEGIAAEAPIGVPDSFVTSRDQPLNVPAAGILANDMDLNYDTLSVSLVSGASNGSLSLSSDGSFNYIPTEGFAGTDSFTYKASDGALNTATITVTITVTGDPSGYYTWRQSVSWDPSDEQDSTGDADQDGIVNFVEFALGLDPLASSASGLPTLTPNGSDYDYDFNNVQPGVNYEVLLSNDLVTWSEPAYAALTNVDSTPVLIPSTVPEAASGKLFVRLRISE